MDVLEFLDICVLDDNYVTSQMADEAVEETLLNEFKLYIHMRDPLFSEMVEFISVITEESKVGKVYKIAKPEFQMLEKTWNKLCLYWEYFISMPNSIY